MTVARPSAVRPYLLLSVVAVAACSASIKPISAPVPLEPPPSPPATARAPRSGSDTARTRTADSPPDDEAVTVLPSIIGKRATGAAEARIPTVRTNRRVGADEPVRVALALGETSARISATGAWALYEPGSGTPIARLGPSDTVTVGQAAAALIVRGAGRAGGRPMLVASTSDGSALTYNGRRYRGELVLASARDGVMVVNRVGMEDYLRGVVPLEIGVDRTPFEAAAVEAQAVAARSYAYTKLDDSRPYDVLATVTDQVYGGMDAERPVADAAVDATRDMVLMYGGRIINAPYHANSGGVTAAASEVWRSSDEPYLVSVSDRIPGTDRFYDEESPKFRWSRTLDAATLASAAARYLPQYARAPRSGLGRVVGVRELGRTPSGRVAGLEFETEGGTYAVRANDVRFVLRAPGGDVLPSTLFTMEPETDDDGRLVRLTLRGTGNGHGVGMDQWGAIARARAGQDFRTILSTYYPGTTVGRGS